MIVQARDFNHLKGKLIGISDRALVQHLELYEGYVRQLAAIEASYPLTDWGPSGGAVAPAAGMEQLLKAPVKSLELEPIGPLEDCIRKLALEMQFRGIKFLPLLYLGDGDFWTADRGISVSMPWYLANPTLWRLANRQSGTSYTQELAMRCLRHETGHAVCYAWELWRGDTFKRLFGDSQQAYKESFVPDPNSQAFVDYLTDVPDHYAQKHPDEDFAETFACWLDPLSNWREEYTDWPIALEKFDYVDRAAKALLSQSEPTNIRPGRPVPYTTISKTVGELLGTAEGAFPFSGLPGWSEHAELLRREPHVYDAVVLHETYFEGLGGAGKAEAAPGPTFLKAAAELQWGSWESYLRDLRAAAGTANPGWAVTCFDPRAGRLRNALVEGHGSGLLAGAPILLAIDCWEHAYAPDYGTRKDAYLAAVFTNLDWGLAERKLQDAMDRREEAAEARP